MNFFVYNGFRSDEAGLLVERRDALGLPTRDVEKIHPDQSKTTIHPTE